MVCDITANESNYKALHFKQTNFKKIKLMSKENDLNEENNGNDFIAAVVGRLSKDTEYRIYLDKMKYEISELVKDCFNPKTDPEVQWKLFREQLTHYKREQILKWLETDDD